MPYTPTIHPHNMFTMNTLILVETSGLQVKLHGLAGQYASTSSWREDSKGGGAVPVRSCSGELYEDELLVLSRGDTWWSW